MKNRIALLIGLLVWCVPSFGQAVAGDPLLKGQADIENGEIAAGAAIASSKLATDVLVEADAGDGLEVVANTLHTKSDEQNFINDLGAGDLSCGASTEGQMAVNDDDPLQYCGGESTPVRHVAAYGADDGDALAGDSATEFFDAGEIEAARGGTGIDTSGSTGITRVNGGTWTADADISHLATSSSADLSGVLSDEEGTGVAVFSINPTLTDVIIDDLLTFAESAGDATCAAGDYWIKGNSTSNTIRGCENGNLFTPSDTGNPLAIDSPESRTVTTGVVTFTGAADTLTYHTILGEAAADDDLVTCNCTAGSQHVIYAENATQTITVQCTGSPDFLMDNVDDRMELHCVSSNTMVEISRANGGT